MHLCNSMYQLAYFLHDGTLQCSVFEIQYKQLCTLYLINPAARPEWKDLIEMDRKDGKGTLRIIDFIATHSPSKVDDFAQLLLNDHVLVQGLHEDKKDKKEFVRAVLKEWISNVDGHAVPCTWESLLQLMKRAALDGVTVRDIKANVS